MSKDIWTSVAEEIGKTRGETLSLWFVFVTTEVAEKPGVKPQLCDFIGWAIRPKPTTRT